jgi:hypothetical protein
MIMSALDEFEACAMNAVHLRRFYRRDVQPG